MEKTIKLAAVHSKDEWPWEGADPYDKCFEPGMLQKFIEHNIERTLEFLHGAGEKKVDLVCTHEDFKGSGAYLRHMDHPELFSSLIEEIPGPTSHKIGEIAKHYKMYVAANYFEKCEDLIYNTTVLIGRAGEVVGKYRKVHLPPTEKWRVTGGQEFSVFDTDFGRIGFATCYDIYFPEHCRAVALNGADIIVHQTQGWGFVGFDMGEALLRTRAAENSAYIVAAKNIQPGDGGFSCIISNYGKILGRSAGDDEEIVTVEFKPDFDMVHEDHFNSFFSGVSSIKARQALERVPSLYKVLTTEKPTVLERFAGTELQTAPDKALQVFSQWREYSEAVKDNKPLKTKYHW